MDNDYSNLEAINTVLTSIANTTNNDYGKVALNVYQIYPKKIYYPLSGRVSSNSGVPYSPTSSIVMLAKPTITNASGNYFFSNFNIGLNYARDFVLEYLASAQTTQRYVDIDYINSSGNLVQQLNFPLSVSATAPRVTLSNIVNINSIRWSDLSSNDNIPTTVELAVRPASIPGDQFVYYSCIRTGSCGTAIITIPNGYIGVISNIGYYSNSSIDSIMMVVKDQNNNVAVTRYTTAGNTIDDRYNSMGDFNFPLYPGQSVFFLALGGTTTERFVNALVTLTAV